MSVKIRLKRVGVKKKSLYIIVIIDSRISKNSKYIDKIGIYDPINNVYIVNNKKRIKWIKYGAIPTKIIQKIIKKI